MPSASCCFLLVFGFSEKQYQMKSKCHETFWRFFLDKRNLGSFGRRPESSRRLHKATGCAPGGAPCCLVGPTWLRLTWIHFYKFTNIGKPSESQKRKHFHRHKPLFFRDPIWRPFPVLCQRGNRLRRASTSTLLPYRWCVSSSPQTYAIASS